MRNLGIHTRESEKKCLMEFLIMPKSLQFLNIL